MKVLGLGRNLSGLGLLLMSAGSEFWVWSYQPRAKDTGLRAQDMGRRI